MMIHLLVGLLTILVGAELFTNAVEWLGSRLKLSEGVVGNLLSAVGTALPESIVPLVAFLGGGAGASHIGVGAILGAPFMLGTLAMFITGFCAWFFRWRREGRWVLRVSDQIVARDLRFFLLMFLLVLAAAFVPSRLGQIMIAVILIVGYGFYALSIIKNGSVMNDEHLKPLYLGFCANPRLGVIVLQLALGLGAIVGGANYFVAGIGQLAVAFGIAPLVLALLVAPVATELPEKFNSVIWVSQGKDSLALGNITGAMVFQSTMIPALGIFLTDWRLDYPSLFSSGFVILSICQLCGSIRRYHEVRAVNLMFCGLAYGGFLATILWCVL